MKKKENRLKVKKEEKRGKKNTNDILL